MHLLVLGASWLATHTAAVCVDEFVLMHLLVLGTF